MHRGPAAPATLAGSSAVSCAFFAGAAFQGGAFVFSDFSVL
jgi:hypothetical protein